MKKQTIEKALLRKTWFAAIVCTTLFAACGFGFNLGWNQIKKPILVALTFHGVTEKPSLPWEIHPETLDGFLRQLKRHEYQAVSPASFSDLLNNGFSGRNFLMTFDDGLEASAAAIKKLYTEYRIESVLFVVTDLIGTPGYMNRQTLLDLQGNYGCHIGLHGRRHYEVSKILAEGGDLTAEIEQARADLSMLTRNVIDWYAYPFGDYNASSAACIASTGIRLAFTIEGTDINRSENRLTLPRVMYLKGAKEAGEADPTDWLPPQNASTGSLTITLSLLVGFLGISWFFKGLTFYRALKKSRATAETAE